MGMQISLDKPELQRFVQEQIEQGHFQTAEEVVHGALSLLQAHEQLSAEELSQLRKQINTGIAQADRGETTPWNRDEIEAEVERRHRENPHK